MDRTDRGEGVEIYDLLRGHRCGMSAHSMELYLYVFGLNLIRRHPTAPDYANVRAHGLVVMTSLSHSGGPRFKSG